MEQRANDALDNLKSTCLHMFLRVEPFLMEANPPPDITEAYQDMVAKFQKITDFIATKRRTAAQVSSMIKLKNHILDDMKRHSVDDLFEKLEDGESWEKMSQTESSNPIKMIKHSHKKTNKNVKLHSKEKEQLDYSTPLRRSRRIVGKKSIKKDGTN